jgi:hypothetical protein
MKGRQTGMASISPHAQTPPPLTVGNPERSEWAGALLEALLDNDYDHAEEMLKAFTAAELRRLSMAAQDLAHLARAAALRPYLHLDEIAGLGRD